MRAIFISYRRDDTEGYAGRLFQDLCERFGRDSVFMDVASIEPGRDFRRVIEQQVASCGVLLAIIGKAWLTVADTQSRRRLDDPHDFVRLETASALKRDIPVIPVLVQQAEMPRAEQLPDDLKDLAFRNSVELTHARWDSDVELLIAALRRYVDPSGPTAAAAAAAPLSAPRAAPASAHKAWVIAPLATLALGGIGYVAWDRLSAGAEETKDTASTAPPMGAGSAPAHAVAPILLASAPAPRLEPALAPLPAPAAAPVPVDTSVPKRAVDNPEAPQPASAQHVDRPVVAKAPTPAKAPAPTRAPTTVSKATTTSVPSMNTPVAPPADTARAPAPVVPAPAAKESPPPEVALARRDPGLELLGGPGSLSTVTRTIVIKPDTRYVNVTGGEVIRFEVGNKSFLWNFNGQRSNFDLARVAPPSVLDHKVTAYVAPNPMYRRRGG